MNTYQNTIETQLDQLKEVMNIGASHASTALSKLIGKRVMLTVPTAFMGALGNNLKMIDGIDFGSREVKAVVMRSVGDISGILCLFISNEGCEKITKLIAANGVKVLHNNVGDIKETVEAMSEVGDILGEACISALSKFLDIRIVHSGTSLSVGTPAVLINTIVMEVGRITGTALAFQVSFLIQGESVDSRLLFFVDENSAKIMLNILAAKVNCC